MEEPWRSVPRSVRDALDERGIRADGVRAAACCDMSKEGELRNIYLFLTADALLLGVSDRTGEMAYAGAPVSYTHLPSFKNENMFYSLLSI